MSPKNIILSNVKMTELADALGLKLSTVSRVVHGNRLSVPVGQAIADYLGKPIKDLFPAIYAKILQAESRRKPQRIPVDPDDLSGLRKACKQLMVDLGLDGRGFYAVILPLLCEKMGKRINANVFCMTMTGFRRHRVSQEILLALHDLLKNWPQRAA